jgi:ABC-type Fe2+-enterobactin transport system substrate-binding protein
MMLTKTLITLTLTATSLAGGTELLQHIQPHAETITIQQTLATTLDNYHMLILTGMTQEQAQITAIKENPNAENLSTIGAKFKYQVGNTCQVAYFSDEYKKLFENC